MRIVDPAGKPVRDAVVIYYPGGAPGRSALPGGRHVVAQRNLQLQPLLTVVLQQSIAPGQRALNVSVRLPAPPPPMIMTDY